MKQNIVVSGMGAITACGVGVEPLWQAITNNQSAIKPIEHQYDLKNKISIAAKIGNFVHTDYFSRQTRIDLFSAYAAIATREAIADSKISQEELSDSRTGIILGNGFPAAESIYNFITKLNAESHSNDIFTIPRAMTNAAISYICIENKIYGPSYPIGSGCSASNQAIGLAYQLIKSGILDRAIVGGTEASLQPWVIRAWEYMNSLTTDTIKPFSLDRDGIVLGEGSGMLIIEREADVLARGVTPHAYVLGYGTSNDAHHLVQPDNIGLIKSMQCALEDSNLELCDINYINAHGTGTKLNDKNEVAGIKKVFGKYADLLPISSTKPIYGHMLVATGGIEAIITIKAMQNSFAPPTLNYTLPDPECDMDVIPNIGRKMHISYAMTNNFAFGGINSSLVLGKY
jgi:nodulation protein E